MSTLGELRARLNEQLGIDDGAEKPWGNPARRNSAIRFGFEQLEPVMQRLLEEPVTPATDTREYSLSTIDKVIAVEITNSAGNVSDVKNWRSWTVAGTTKVTFAAVPNSDASVKVIGYKPYTSVFAADNPAADIEESLEWIPLLGALAELYRRRFHEWMDFERYTASNPTSVVDPDTIYRAYTDAMARFEQAKLDHMRSVAAARRASFVRD